MKTTTEVRWLDDREQAVWRAYLHMTVLVNEQLERQLQRDAAMPMSYYLVLAMLSEAPDRTLRMQQLAQVLRVSQSRTSHAISRIEEKGWVRRRPSSCDGRGTEVQLTDDGFARLVAMAPDHVEAVRRVLFDALSPTQVTQLGAICDTVLRSLDLGEGVG
ncbi:MAG: MarR family winged helix-turn-helix transcriptional regulator [Nocardioidaceae bacterium]